MPPAGGVKGGKNLPGRAERRRARRSSSPTGFAFGPLTPPARRHPLAYKAGTFVFCFLSLEPARTWGYDGHRAERQRRAAPFLPRLLPSVLGQMNSSLAPSQPPSRLGARAATQKMLAL